MKITATTLLNESIREVIPSQSCFPPKITVLALSLRRSVVDEDTIGAQNTIQSLLYLFGDPEDIPTELYGHEIRAYCPTYYNRNWGVKI